MSPGSVNPIDSRVKCTGLYILPVLHKTHSIKSTVRFTPLEESFKVNNLHKARGVKYSKRGVGGLRERERAGESRREMERESRRAREIESKGERARE